MKEVFADSGYFIALLSRDDAHHAAASELAVTLAADRGTRLVTTDTVIAETLNGVARKGEQVRAAAATLARQFLDQQSVIVVPHTRQLLRDGVDRYAARLDKGWGLVDCVSMVVMEQRGITEALTLDHGFEQAGFRRLL
ncbi:MAG: PIN domain-containing protein [Chloroflexota bacterium]|nr:PIN domain-containing protein [Chloroflexota bacterium]